MTGTIRALTRSTVIASFAFLERELSDDEDFHPCHFCGTEVKDGKEYNGARHFLSDCRPDLVQHEIGPLCTWAHQRGDGKTKENQTCYAYQNPDKEWTDKHEHFYPDGPM